MITQAIAVVEMPIVHLKMARVGSQVQYLSIFRAYLIDPLKNNGDVDNGGNNIFGYRYEYETVTDASNCPANISLPVGAHYWKLEAGLENLKDKALNYDVPS